MTEVAEFSAANQLLHDSKYTYDFLDHRIAVSSGGVLTRSVYAGSFVWADYNASNTLTASYLYGTQADELFARLRPARVSPGICPIGLAPSATSLIARARSPTTSLHQLRRLVSETNAAAGDRFKFTGRELDFTGLYYYRARYYDPRTGRFISEDPAGFRAGDTNLSRYVANSPTNAIDPTGLQALSEWAKGVLQRFNTGVALSYGADTPFTFRINGGGISGGLGGPPALGGNFSIPNTSFHRQFAIFLRFKQWRPAIRRLPAGNRRTLPGHLHPSRQTQSRWISYNPNGSAAIRHWPHQLQYREARRREPSPARSSPGRIRLQRRFRRQVTPPSHQLRLGCLCGRRGRAGTHCRRGQCRRCRNLCSSQLPKILAKSQGQRESRGVCHFPAPREYAFQQSSAATSPAHHAAAAQFISTTVQPPRRRSRRR